MACRIQFIWWEFGWFLRSHEVCLLCLGLCAELCELCDWLRSKPEPVFNHCSGPHSQPLREMEGILAMESFLSGNTSTKGVVPTRTH